jgi:hypothetical protein
MATGDRTLYVYALAERGLPARMRIHGRLLRTLTIGDVAVVVELSPERPQADVEVLQEQHDVLVRLAARGRALLPARFGTLLTEAHLRATVAEHAVSITSALTRVRGRCQMTIRVFGTPDASTPPVNRTAGGAAYLRSRRARAAHRPADADAIHHALAPLASDERVEAGRDTLRVTVFHLIPETSVAAYRQEAAGLQAILAPSRLTVTGPWPPFAFSPELI